MASAFCRGALKQLLFALALVGASFGTALAQGYVDVDPQMEQQVSAPLFVTISYSVIWLVLLLYVVALWRRQGRLSAEIAELRRTLERAE